MELAIGTRIYNHGDMANISHFGTITDVRTDRWGTNVEITPDADSDRQRPYWIPVSHFAPTYERHGGTRFVTEAAYQEWRQGEMAAWRQRLGMGT